MRDDKVQQTLATVGDAIGRGLLAGLAGTAAITLSQLIEMQFTKRNPSQAPVKVAGQALGVTPSNKQEAEELSGEPVAPGKTNEQVKEEHAQRFSQFMHWQYGTGWGVARGLLSTAAGRQRPCTSAPCGARPW